jgi:hypothetical protein
MVLIGRPKDKEQNLPATDIHNNNNDIRIQIRQFLNTDAMDERDLH